MNQRRWKRRLLPGLALVLTLSQRAHSAQMRAQTPLAVLNGKPITENDLAAFDRGQITRMNNQIYLTRKQTLDAYLTEQLITQEAKKRSITREQLVTQEITGKVATPTDAEVEKWYNENKGRVGGKPLAEIKDQIVAPIEKSATTTTATRVSPRLAQGCGPQSLTQTASDCFDSRGLTVPWPRQSPSDDCRVLRLSMTVLRSSSV